VGAVEDILEWSATRLTPWRQDALRRLASSSSIGIQDHNELLSLIKDEAGFPLPAKPPAPIPLTKAHLSVATAGSPVQVKAIRNVENVNRLVPSAGLAFASHGLTVIYGRNGSGKSGFVRILRIAPLVRLSDSVRLGDQLARRKFLLLSSFARLQYFILINCPRVMVH
jgi:hypothetical protein